MAKIVSVYSDRGGTGKTTCLANIAAIVASWGYRVGVVDANLPSPGIHLLFGFDQHPLQHSLNDYLWLHCPLQAIVHDVTAILPEYGHDRRQLYVVPASTKLGDKARVLREGYDVRRLQQGLQRLVATLQLDYLFIDTHPGLSEETLLALDESDVVLFIFCPDQQDFAGMQSTLTLAQRFAVPQFLAIMNKTPTGLDIDPLISQVKTSYGITVTAVLPHTENLLRFASRGLFTFTHPTHRFTHTITGIARHVIGQSLLAPHPLLHTPIERQE